MLISCKCLNFIATSSAIIQQQQERDLVKILSLKSTEKAESIQNDAPIYINNETSTSSVLDSTATVDTMSSNKFHIKDVIDICDIVPNTIIGNLKQLFLKKYVKNFIYYSQCIEFFRQAIGPITNLSINQIAQKDLIFSMTLDLVPQCQAWQLNICSNCNSVLCAKLLANGTNVQSTTQPVQYLINNSLLTNRDELMQKRSNKSFSEAFGLLIMDHTNYRNNNLTPQVSTITFNVGSLSSINSNIKDPKQIRLRQLQANMQQRVQREITETDERIQRFTQQQFALLKDFREKSEQEYQILSKLIQSLSDQLDGETLDRTSCNLEIDDDSCITGYLTLNGTRRHNPMKTATNKLEMPLVGNILQMSSDQKNTSHNTTESEDILAINNINNPNLVANLGVSSTYQRKLLNFDTPPATPEAVTININDSPTYRQQQSQKLPLIGSNKQISFQQQFPTPTAEIIDDYIFDIDVEVTNKIMKPNIYNRQTTDETLYNFINDEQQHADDNTQPQKFDYNMSNFNESNDHGEKEIDTTDMCVTKPILMQHKTKKIAQIAPLNYAKSLPMEIPKPPMKLETNQFRTNSDADDNDIDNKMDIAASIKALARSVHGEAVFGDLPRPRLRSQI